MKSYLLILFGALIFTSCKKDGYSTKQHSGHSYTQAHTVVYKSISGVSSNLLSLDIYHQAPGGPARPVILYIHGGAWKLGDKANQLNNKLHLFSSLNYVFVSINYRLSPMVTYPAYYEDVRDAVAWVKQHIADYGGDSARLVLMGHSAGANMAVSMGTSPNFLPSLGFNLNDVCGIISLDAAAYDFLGLSEKEKKSLEPVFSSNDALLKSASPFWDISFGRMYPRFLLVYRGRGDHLKDVQSFGVKMMASGASVCLVDGGEYDHEGINDAVGAPEERLLTEPLIAFLRTCFGE